MPARLSSSIVRRMAPWLLFLLGLLAFPSVLAQQAAAAQAPAKAARREPPFRLREAAGEASAPAPSTPAGQAQAPQPEGTPLPPEEAARILGRLPPLPVEEPAIPEVILPRGAAPPPRPGRTIETPFPPAAPLDARSPDTAPGRLTILRRSPEGEVPSAESLSVTFSEPMVPLGSAEDLAAQATPMKLAPSIPGTWRWAGTRTLVFEPGDGRRKVRFPMAARWDLEIPAGTTSALGARLEESVAWSFATPHPQVLHFYPPDSGVHSALPLIVFAFNQRVHPEAVLQAVRVRTPESEHPLRLATSEELQELGKVVGWHVKDESGFRPQWRWVRLSELEAGRCVAFRPLEPLPPATEVRARLSAGAAVSAEGPRTTWELREFRFNTRGPLKVARHFFGRYSKEEARPECPLTVEFTNPIDHREFDPSQVRVEPELPGMEAATLGDELRIEGPTRARTRYKVTLASTIRDVFGQTLGEETTLTFDVGSDGKWLHVPGEVTVLDPGLKPAVSAYTVNLDSLKARAYKVGPADWRGFYEYREKLGEFRFAPPEKRPANPPDPPGALAFEKKIEVKAVPDDLVETEIDLAPALDQGVGQILLIVETLPPERWQFEIRWIQATRIGLEALVDPEEMIAWTTSLEGGSPLEGIEVSLFPSGRSARTGKEGIATLLLVEEGKGDYLLVGRKDGDLAILPVSWYWRPEGDGWKRQVKRDVVRCHLFADREPYRPGEEVHVKGWVRRLGMGKGGDVGFPAGIERIAWRAQTWWNKTLAKGEAPLGPLGGFDLGFTLPRDVELGGCELEIEGAGAGEQKREQIASLRIQVEEFRRPEFELKVTREPGPFVAGDPARVEVAAQYLSGGGLPGAEVTWEVKSSPSSLSLRDWPDFTFGTWVPWWDPEGESFHAPEALGSDTLHGRTDADGVHRLEVDLPGTDPPRPFSLNCQATVMDLNRQDWTSSEELLVVPAALYIGLKAEGSLVEAGQPIRVTAIVTDLAARPVIGRAIHAEAARLELRKDKRRLVVEEKESRSQDLVSALEPVEIAFDPGPAGRYRIRASVTDDRGRRAESEVTCWVSGEAEPSYRGLVDAELSLAPDKSEYRPGDKARILLTAPFYPAEGRTTWIRSGILRTERFLVDTASTIIEVPIDEAHVPNLGVLIDLVGSAPRRGAGGKPDPGLPPRPARAFGYVDLKVPPDTRRLSVEVKPREAALKPGGETELDLRVRDAKGQPAEGAEVCLAVVDDAVLALSGYRPPGPLQSFYEERDPQERSRSLRAYIDEGSRESVSAALRAWRHPPGPTLALPEIEGGGPRAPVKSVTLGPPGEKGRDGVSLRSDFNPLALFAASVLTGPDGTAQVPLKLPGNVTRYKIFAAAAGRDGRSFGTAEGSLVARLPLIVRPSPPRFLYSGDRFELPVLVQNGTEKPLEADVAVRGANGLEWTGPTARRVAVPAEGRVEVRFPGAASRAGAAPIQVAAVAADLADAAQVSVPVHVPLTLEAFAAYFEVDAGPIAQPLLAPAGAREDFGGLEIETSSTVLHTLSDAYLYLSEYPYGCAEQISSRVLAAAGLGEALRAFSREVRPAEVQAAVKGDLKGLASFQNEDGGFGFWSEERSSPYVSVHVAHALAAAKAAGFEIPRTMEEGARRYLRDIGEHIPREYPGPVRNAIEAYTLRVRRKLDPQAGPAAAESLARARELASLPPQELSPEAAAWLLPILSADPGSLLEADSLRKRISNCVEETAGLAHCESPYPEGGQRLLGSARRADAVVLDALLETDPGNDLIPKLLRGLLAHRLQGRWSTTQENAFVLLALGKYFERAEAEPPDFVARAWLAGQQVLEERFAGRSDEWRRTTIPMSRLVRGENQEILLAREGRGRLYVRLGLRSAPSGLNLPPLDQGIVLARAYEAVDDPLDVRRDGEGAWHVRAGSLVRVRVGLETLSRRHHVALVDPVPAGFEIENPWLLGWRTPPRTGEAIPRFPADHQNLRDDRAEVFASVLEQGCYAFIYTARATTRGTFVAPPSRAEEMYQSETHGRGCVDIVVVE